jgi:Ni/Co efflux regulator RcnB
MKKFISALLAATLLTVPVAASAHDYDRGSDRAREYDYDRYRRHDRHDEYDHRLLPLGIGLLLGGVIVNAARSGPPPTYYTAPDYYPTESVTVLNRYYVHGRGMCETHEIRDAYGRWLRTEQFCY